MSMTPLRKNVALAIDGGGIKGLIIALALQKLEDELGGGPLINHPQIKVLAGTSTGSLITAGIAIGMKSKDIAQIYADLGTKVFPPLTPHWLPELAATAVEEAEMLFKPSLYSNENLKQILKQVIKKYTGNAELTLADLKDRLGPDKAVIFTTVNIDERQTYFLKSYKSNEDNYGQWTLWQAVLASSSAPIALPVLPHPDSAGKTAYFTDGGVGNYGNPAYIAAQEAVTFRGYPPQDVSVLSFGSGWVNAENYQKANGVPTEWHALGWARNVAMLFVGDAARAQSMEILADFADQKLDFRRFQFALQKDIDADSFGNPGVYDMMKQLGKDLGERISANRFAPNADAQYDPEGLYNNFERYEKAKSTGRTASTSK